MRDIFLGKPWHWSLLAGVAFLLWWAGTQKAHVIQFNSFLIALAVGSLAIIVLILKTTKSDEQITREQLEPDQADEGDSKEQTSGGKAL